MSRPRLSSRASALGTGCEAVESMVVTDTGQAGALWRIRADGAGLSSRSPAGLPAHAAGEDAAAPDRMGTICVTSTH